MANYIISIDNTLDLASAQARITDAGGTINSTLAITNTFDVECTAEQLGNMLNVAASAEASASLSLSMQSYDRTHLLATVYGRSEIWDGTVGDTNFKYNGTGTHVYLVDTGINETHTEFASASINNLWSAYGSDFSDTAGHGTAMASLIVGGNVGAAPAAVLHNVKLFSANSGNVSVGEVISAFNAVAIHHNDNTPANVKVVCAPWTVDQNDLIDDIIRSLNSSNLVVVAAAGNDGVDVSTKSPAGVKEIVTVGAYDNSYTVTSFTNTATGTTGFVNFGSGVDIFGFGVGVTVADFTDVNSYSLNTGTSVATATAAGIITHYIQAYTNKNSAEIKEIVLTEGHLNRGNDFLTFDSGVDYTGVYRSILTAESTTKDQLASTPSGRIENVQLGGTATVNIGLSPSAANVAVLDFAPTPPWITANTVSGVVSIDATSVDANLAPGVYIFAIKGEVAGEILVEEYSVGLYATDESEVSGDTAVSSFYYDADNNEYDELVNYQVAPTFAPNPKP